MNKPIIKLQLAALLCLLVPLCVHAQKTADSSAVNSAASAAINFFNTGIGKQSRIYNGKEFTEYDPNIRDNPYFADIASFKTATIDLNGYTYNNVPAKYDLYKDQLIALYFNNASSYILAAKGVTSFNLYGHNFKYVSADTVAKGPGSGYYEQLFSGKVSALAKYSKTLQSTSSGASLYFTKTNTQYFIQKGNMILPVSSESSLLSILKDRKKELQQYIKSNNINFKQDRAKSLAAIAGYYDHLHN